MNLTSSPSASYGSPGAAIRDARNRAGISIDELGSRTRLTRQTLEAMESDAFEKLLEPVYVRGYYRKCARILEIPEQPLIDAYDALYTPTPKIAPARLRLASGGDLGSAPRLSARFAILAAIAAIVICVVIWTLRQASTPTAATPTVSLIDGAGPEGAISDTMPPLVDAPADPTGAVPSGELATADVPPQPQPVGTQLVLVFKGISWTRVVDASGKSLLSGVISEGETRTLDGQPPYAIFFGNAPGVSVQFGGLPVDVRPYTKSNSTARFSVPAAGP